MTNDIIEYNFLLNLEQSVKSLNAFKQALELNSKEEIKEVYDILSNIKDNSRFNATKFEDTQDYDITVTCPLSIFKEYEKKYPEVFDMETFKNHLALIAMAKVESLNER